MISDLLSLSGRRILGALGRGETNPEILAALGDERLKCGREVLVDALTGAMGTIHCKLLAQHLKRIELIDQQIEELNKLSAAQMQKHQDTVVRLIEVPGIGAEAAQEIIAEIGPEAAAFPSAAQLSSWVGVCPGMNESAGKNHSGSSAKGNRFLRRLLCQSAQASVRTKGSHLQYVFQRLLIRLGYAKAIWALAHRMCKLLSEDSASGSQIHRVRRSHKPEGGKALRQASIPGLEAAPNANFSAGGRMAQIPDADRAIPGGRGRRRAR